MGAIGLVEVDEVLEVLAGSISTADAHRSGFDDAASVRKAASQTELADEDVLYRVSFRYVGADTRPGPARGVPDVETVAELASKLDAMDRRSKRGAWTRPTLRMIGERPRTAASKLAPEFDLETQAFKADVRKLKRLGLTISHEVGYELSARGVALLDAGERATAR